MRGTTMARTLIIVPAMYGREELNKTLGLIPSDFEESYSEFWSYVEEKLRPFIGKVCVVYSDRLSPAEETEIRANALIKRLIENRSAFHCVEDSLLAAEAEAWLEMMENGRVQAAVELFEENLMERDEYARDVIEQTLRDDEMGVLFIDPSRKISFPEDIRVIRMCPFDPVDYLNLHLVKLKIEKREEQ